MSGDNGQSAPGWFKDFVVEYCEDRDDTRNAMRMLTGSIHSLTEHVNRNSIEIHEMHKEQEQMCKEQEQTNRELVKTRKQSANLFNRLIVEVKTLQKRG